MEKEFVKLFYSNKETMKSWISDCDNHAKLNYGDFVKKLFEVCFKDWDSNEIVEVDHGSYSGCKIWLIHRTTYQPSLSDYVWTNDYYGSCSGCDTLQRISSYTHGKPNEKQVKDYMNVMLHLVQKIKYLSK